MARVRCIVSCDVQEPDSRNERLNGFYTQKEKVYLTVWQMGGWRKTEGRKKKERRERKGKNRLNPMNHLL